jgi:hypothetical protein
MQPVKHHLTARWMVSKGIQVAQLVHAHWFSSKCIRDVMYQVHTFLMCEDGLERGILVGSGF